MSAPWLSVVVPTFNGERYLRQMLDGICTQSEELLAGVEVIAIDDGSTDRTVEILHSYEDRFSLEILPVAPSHNWVKNTNLGISRTHGTYLSLLHQDDLWLPERLAVLHRLIDETPEAGLIVHPVRYLDDRGAPVGNMSCPFPTSGGALDPAFVVERLLVQNFFSIPAPLFKRETALQVGGLDETLWYTADWDFWLKLAMTSPALRYHPEPLAAFRLHAHSLTNRGSAESEAFRAQLETALGRQLAQWEQRSGSICQDLRKVASFSIEANVFLAARAHGQKSSWTRLLKGFLALGLRGGHRYLRDSRIFERVRARLRAVGPNLS